MRALIRVRSASPTSMFLPETRNGMIALRYGLLTTTRSFDIGSRPQHRQMAHRPLELNTKNWAPPELGARTPRNGGGGAPRRKLLLAPPLHRGRDAHGFAILCNGPARDVDPGRAQPFHDGVVGENILRAFRIDQLLDAVTH